MWSFFRSAAPTPITRARLGLESLDGRSAPSAMIGPLTGAPSLEYIAAPAPDAGTGAATQKVGVPGVNQSPRIDNFEAAQETGNIWRFTGDVTDEQPGGLTITFGGEPVTLRGYTTRTDANGHFDLLIAMNTDGSDDGVATAQTADPQGASSNLATYSILPSA
jgi:hypothetical protein